MESSICLLPPARLRLESKSWFVAAASCLPFLFAPVSALAALSEYRVMFEPSSSLGAVGYTLHVGTSTGQYDLEFDLGDPARSGGTIVYAVDLEDSVDIFVALQAYDISGVSSGFSNEMQVAAVIPEPPLSSPSDPIPPSADEPSEEPAGEPTGDPVSDPLPPEATIPSGLHAATIALTTLEGGQIVSVLGNLAMELLTIDSLAAGGDLRPVRCDLDADGDKDIVIGFGPGSGGRVAILHVEGGKVVSAQSLDTASKEYRDNPAAATSPACGDLDGDGLGEIVVGFGPEFPRRVQVFDDQSTGFATMSGGRLSEGGFLKLQRRRQRAVALYPAIGDIDGDGRDELVVGSGSGGGMGLAIRDDALADFARHPSAEGRKGTLFLAPPIDSVPTDGWGMRPAIGDIDGDGFDEIAISFGAGSGGYIMVLDDARSGYTHSGSGGQHYLVAGREPYRASDGETHVALGDLDEDGIDEMVVGFRRSARGEFQVFKDVMELNGRVIGSGNFLSIEGLDAAVFPSPNR